MIEAEVWADNPDDVEELYAELRGVKGVSLGMAPAVGEPGDQGVTLDLLTVALSSGAVTAFLQIIKALADSRRPKFMLSIRHGKNVLKISANNFSEVEPAIRRLFGGSGE